MSGLEVDTQDICSVVRDADESGEDDNVFFLYVATPGKPPSSLHKKVIEPFLKEKGWQKVSYKDTGFRALYFLHEKDENCNDFEYRQCQSDSDVVVISNEDDSQLKRAAKTINRLESSPPFNATQKATNHRSELKKRIDEYKKEYGFTFDIHIVLSRPIDYVEDFAPILESQSSMEF